MTRLQKTVNTLLLVAFMAMVMYSYFWFISAIMPEPEVEQICRNEWGQRTECV